jgi:hypothetical protein
VHRFGSVREKTSLAGREAVDDHRRLRGIVDALIGNFV